MAVEEREFGWEDIIQNDSSFVEFPEGDYNFVIDHFDRGRSQGSNKIPASNMAIVYFRIKDSNGNEALIRENFILHTKLEWKLSELFCSVGLKEKGKELRMNWNALPGLTGRAHVILQPDRNDPSKKYNHIDKLYPKEPKKFEAGKF